jgi:hypothetical protein
LILDGKAASEFHLTVSYRKVAERKAIADRKFGFTVESTAGKSSSEPT